MNTSFESHGRSTLKSSITSGWDSLLPELIQHVAKFLSANEVACSLRQLCHSTASALSGPQYKSVQLSQYSPHHAFVARWGTPGAKRSLSRKRKGDLVRLTSISGSVQNLEFAVERVSCPLTEEVTEAAAGAGQLDVLRWLQDQRCRVLTVTVLSAAAAGGHLDVCVWLRDRGCPFIDTARLTYPLEWAARTGRQDVCAWLLAYGCRWSGGAVCAAAAGGHVTLMDWLLQRRPAAAEDNSKDRSMDVYLLLQSVAEGCPLPVLQRLHREWAEGRGGWLEDEMQGEEDERERYYQMESIVAAAAASTNPDWVAKVVWLQQERGYPLTAEACSTVAERCPTDEEVLARLKWLHGRRGCGAARIAPLHAAGRGLSASLCYLLAEDVTLGGQVGKAAPLWATAGGHLACLQALHAAGIDVKPGARLSHAARAAHLPVVRWLVETPGLEVPLTAEVAAAAAASGSLELLSYLHERGSPWDVKTWMNAVLWGSEEMREWLRERGCPTQ